jgi:hypothetical protein
MPEGETTQTVRHEKLPSWTIDSFQFLSFRSNLSACETVGQPTEKRIQIAEVAQTLPEVAASRESTARGRLSPRRIGPPRRLIQEALAGFGPIALVIALCLAGGVLHYIRQAER